MSLTGLYRVLKEALRNREENCGGRFVIETAFSDVKSK
ncbi:MAG: hypothetical protein K0R55_2280, partial [Sporomusa sp.]|nr:hypothetical protein [Sporomusa sp.]